MRDIFAMDGKIFSLFGRVADLFLLNVLWLLFSIPIITAGASTTALYAVTLKMARNEESYICSTFISSFKKNLVQTTGIWSGILAAAIVLGIDFYAVGRMKGKEPSLLISLLLVTFLIVFFGNYIFPIIAWFKGRIGKLMKNALLLAVGYFPYTIVIIFIGICPVLLAAVGKVPILLFADIMIGPALAAYCNSYLFRRIFDKVITNDEKVEEIME